MVSATARTAATAAAGTVVAGAAAARRSAMGPGGLPPTLPARQALLTSAATIIASHVHFHCTLLGQRP